MTYSQRFSMLVLSAVVVAIAACEPAAPPVAPAPPKVNVAHPESRDYVEADEYNGWISAYQSVEVRARVSGHLQTINFTDGQIVQKDEVLFQLDPRPFEADVARANDQLHIYEAQVVAAQKEEARLKDLQSKGGSSQSQVDKAEADRISLEAEAEGARHSIDYAKLNLEYARITAPFSGRITNSVLCVVNRVTAGGSVPVLTTIVSTTPVYVNFSVDERAMQRYQSMNLRKTQADEPRSGALKSSQLPFQFQLETEKDFPHQGILDFVDNQVDQQTGTISVRGTIPNPEGLFTPGSRVKIRVPIGTSRSVLLVPDTAVLSDQGQTLRPHHRRQERRPAAGHLPRKTSSTTAACASSSPTPTEKASSPDDWIIVLGIQSARINYPVEPIKPSTTTAATMASQ